MDDFLLLLLSTLDSTLRVSAPLVLCAMAGIFSERSGIIDISLEGKLLGSAFAAAAVAAVSGSAFVGLGAAIITSILMALLHGFACITHRGNQVVSGLAINILASGLTVTLGGAWFHKGGQTPTLSGDARFSPITLPGADFLSEIPILGSIYVELISGHNLLVYIAFLAVPVTWWVLYKTRFGLRLRAVGENPQAVDTAGISVTFLRYRSVIIAGILCGIAGAYLSTGQNAAFGKEMSAGQGYIALAAMIFGKWKPVPGLLACMLFGFLDAMAVRLQGVAIPGIGEIPVQFMQALPYVLTVILLAGFIGKAIAPKAIGRPYVKER
ncbi:ABC transporter permease [uncultured Kiloniella sp.]|uniref:ABC transporter permease n=1 Tax=uncultured Kiloniella sp. TaxID=1133091 RepID=UPI002626FBB7|nr:ABC transporter permease [uncultured Kiloniella sp.]